MANHKKTRKQKQVADLRRQLLSQKSVESSPRQDTKLTPVTHVNESYSITENLNSITTRKPVYQFLYPFVAADLRKTAYVSSGIIVAYLLLFILLHNHFLALPSTG